MSDSTNEDIEQATEEVRALADRLSQSSAGMTPQAALDALPALNVLVIRLAGQVSEQIAQIFELRKSVAALTARVEALE